MTCVTLDTAQGSLRNILLDESAISDDPSNQAEFYAPPPHSPGGGDQTKTLLDAALDAIDAMRQLDPYSEQLKQAAEQLEMYGFTLGQY